MEEFFGIGKRAVKVYKLRDRMLFCMEDESVIVLKQRIRQGVRASRIKPKGGGVEKKTKECFVKVEKLKEEKIRELTGRKNVNEFSGELDSGRNIAIVVEDDEDLIIISSPNDKSRAMRFERSANQKNTFVNEKTKIKLSQAEEFPIEIFDDENAELASKDVEVKDPINIRKDDIKMEVKAKEIDSKTANIFV